MNYNSKCSICGKPYYQCAACPSGRAKPWLSIADTKNHYKIFMILADYTNKKIDAAKAKELLGKCDISDYRSFVPEVANAIGNILISGNCT